MTLGLAGLAFAYTTTSQYAVTDFATGFSDTNIGPIGLAFDASNHLDVMEYPEGILYEFTATAAGRTAGHVYEQTYDCAISDTWLIP
jgi:hypothetical protein